MSREMRRQTPDRCSIEWQNHSNKRTVNFWRSMARKIDEDKDRKKRREQGLCPVCFYQSSRIGAAVCTRAQCGFCDEVLHSGSSNIDLLCQACAIKAGICKHCGADMELKNRRKRELPEPTERRVD